MESKPNRIREFRKALGWTQQRLAEAAGVSPEHISQVESGARNASYSLLIRISNALNVPMGSIFVQEVNGVETQQPKYRIPVKARVIAGIADEAVECLEEPIGWEWSSEEPKDDRDVIEIFGDSMEPEFLEGDRLVVEHHLEPRNGDVVVAEWHPNGDEERLLTVKVYFRKNGMALLVPINRSKYQVKLMDKHWQICGVVVKHIRRQMRGRYAEAGSDLFGS